MINLSTSIFVILCLYITIVSCQQCLSLNGSKTCNMFSTASISIRDAKFVTLPWLVNVSTITEFDRQLLAYVNSTSFWNLELGCKSATLHHRARYAVSLTCATIVFDSKSASLCNPDMNNSAITMPIPLCQSTCESYSKSVQSILSSSPPDSICSLNGGGLITAGANSLSQQCNTNEGLKGQPSTGCISGADAELSMCGFGEDQDTLCRYCNAYDSTLPCCREYDCTASKAILLDTGTIVGIVMGVLSTLFICGFLAFCIVRSIQKKKRRSTHPADFIYHDTSQKNSKDFSCMTSIHIPNSSSTMMMNNNSHHTPESHMMRHVFPIEDEDYMEVVPDINMDCDAEDVKGHVFKVNSLEKQFVRVIYPLKAPENPDELELLKNDIIRMYYYFDDGWAFGDNFGSGLRGLFPILCVVNLTPAEVQELICLSELPDDTLSENNVDPNGEQYYSSVRHFSTGVQYDLDPRSTIRLQTLRRTVSLREKHHSPTSEENNFHYLCATLSSSPTYHHSDNNAAGDGGVPPLRTASMHATFSPRRTKHSNPLQDPLLLQEEDYFRSDSTGSTGDVNNTPDSKTYLNN